MKSDTRSGFAETARGRVHFEVSGPDGAPALIYFGLSRSKGWSVEIEPLYRKGFADFRFLTCDYPVGVGGSERFDNPPPMTPDQVALDYLAIADAAGFERFACAGYSIGGNTGVQLAVRYPERLTALIVGGWPALGGDFKGALEVCKRQRKNLEAADTALTRQYAANPVQRTAAAGVADDFIAYYEALQDWDDRSAARSLQMPRLNFADAEDMGYPANNMSIDIGPALVRNEAELRAMGWETRVLRTDAGANEKHLAAVHPDIVVPILREFLGRVLFAKS